MFKQFLSNIKNDLFKKRNKWVSIITMLIVTLIPVVAGAAIVTAKDKISGYIKDIKRPYDSMGMVYFEVDGKTAYCMDYNLKVPNNKQDYSEDFKINDMSYNIMLNGYSKDRNTGNLGLNSWKEAYHATQLALWLYISKTPSYVTTFKCYEENLKPLNDRGTAILNKAKEIISKAEKDTSKNKARVYITQFGATTEIVDGTRIIGPILFQTNVESADVKINLHNAPSSAKVTDDKGNLKTKFSPNDKFYIRMDSSVPAGTMKITVSGTVKHPTVYAVKPDKPQGKQQKALVPIIKSETSSDWDYVNLKWDSAPIRRAEVRVKKVDATSKKPLVGATFVLEQNNTKVGQSVSDSTGIAKFTGVPFGDYVIKEIKAPDGYILNDKPYPIKIDNNNKIHEFVIENTPKPNPSLKLKKIDADTKQPLAGAKFKLSKDGKVIKEATSDNGGIVDFGALPLGNYVVQEIQAPNGYILNSQEIPVALTEYEKAYEIQLTNDKNIEYKFILQKKDAKTNKPLAGAKFVINKDGKKVTEVTSDVNGTATVNNLSAGTYELKEIQAPNGYILNTEPISFTLTKESPSFTAIIPNQPEPPKIGNVKIRKIDTDTREPLAGAKFKISKDGKVVKEVTTNNTGIADISDLPFGNYVVQEIQAPNGYILNDKPVNINIDTSGKTYEIEISNTKEPPKVGSIKIRKIDTETKEPLANAKFELTKDGSVVTTVSSNADGIATLDNLPFGDYVVKEIVAPEGYLVNPKPIPIKIQEMNKIYEIEITNTKKPPEVGNIKIKKVDEATGKPLAGAKFEISARDQVLKTVTSDANGIATLDGVIFGEYTITEIQAPDGYVITSEPQVINITESGKTYEVRITNKKDVPKTGDIKIKKIDAETKQPLAGAKFKINKGEEVIKEVTTNADGIADITDLVFGNYTVTEIQAPNGYVLNSKPHNITIDTLDKVYEIVVENTKERTPVGIIKIKKTDAETKQPLAGAKFKINKGDEVVSEVTSDAEGIATVNNLPFGTYIVTEIQAPNGYVLDSQPHTIVVDTDNKVYEITVTNTKEQPKVGNVKILKVDSETAEPLAGAKFQISKDGTVVKEVTSGNDGIALIEGLVLGDYVVTEIQAPNGYVLSSDPYPISITENGKTYEISIKNTKERTPVGNIKIKKIDAETKQPLAGAKFKISKGEEVIKEVISNAEGIADITGLPFGDYTVVEIEAPNGYVLNDTPQNVTINEDGKTYEIILENTKQPDPVGNIKIKKIDAETKEPLANAKFKISKGEEVIKEVVSNAEGIADITGLTFGTYTVVEIEAPNGYILNDTPQDVVIDTDGKTYEISIENTKQPEPVGNIKIKKIDAETKEPLAGAKFRIVKGEEVVKEVITNAEGIADITGLLFGTYTVVEIEAPNGYILNDTPQDIVIDTDGKIYEVILENTKQPDPVGSIKIKKIDAETKEPLANAKFRIAKGEEIIKEVISDAEGIATINNLPFGDYVVTEIEAPNGYVLNDTPQNITINEDGKVYEIVLENTKQPEPVGNIKIKKIDAETKEPLAGATFKIAKGEEIIKEVVSDETGIATINNLPFGDYVVTEIQAPSGYILNDTPQNITINEDGRTYEISLENTKEPDPVGDIKIKKIDAETQEPLAGAKFSVSKNDKVIKEVVADETGIATINNLPFGTYQIVEIQAPDGYVLDNTPHNIEVNGDGVVHEITLTNAKSKGRLELTKTDIATGEPLPNAGFRIKNEAGEIVAEGRTDENGVATFELTVGRYTYQEFDAPPGYVIDESEFPFEIRENGEIVKAQMTNEKAKGKLELTKTDVATGEPLPNAGFRIKNEAGEVVVEGRTDENGVATFELALGKYTYQEFDAPPGYVIDESEFPFEIKENGEIVKAEMTNRKAVGNLELTKTDVATGEPLPNAGFRIKNEAGEVVVEGRTDENGVAKFELNIGKYTYQEFDAPPGYVIDESEFPFEIKTDGEIVKAEMTNRKAVGKLELTKKDVATGELLPNAGFKIKNEAGKVVVEGRTDKNGIATFELPVGKYTYQEFDAPPGYIIDESEFPFEIKEDGQIIKAVMKNKKSEGSLELTKKDVATGELLPNAGFRVKDSTGKVVAEGRTDENGVAKFELKVGKYTYQEFDAPPGYLIDESEFPFEIKENGEIVKAEMTNKKKEGELHITKVDVVDGELLPNATFAIYDENKKEVIKGKTDENGLAKFKLSVGKYYYQEIEAPPGYVIDNELYPFELKENGEIVKAKMTNKKLPSTGTMNRNILVGLGISGLLVCSALAFFILKRKNNK